MNWKSIFDSFEDKKYLLELKKQIGFLYESKQICPPKNKIFNAFKLVEFEKIKVVILGQDPYHGIGQANGLAFSVNRGIKIPPSLKNIFKEYSEDLGYEIPKSGNLENWAKQGVFLLNCGLTVEMSKPNSHLFLNWHKLTDYIINQISVQKKNIVFLLWGSYAQKKSILIDKKKHLVLETSHPSPFSVYRGFFGSKHFSKTNKYLKNNNIKEVNWKL